MDITIATDLSEIERKIGRKIPESLFPFAPDGRMMKENTDGRDEWDSPGRVKDMSDTTSLQSNMRLLRQEMSHLRGMDVRLMCQLLSINDGIEATRWDLEV
ncbi:leucine rich adaptor protein 1-like isoform 1-T1 [Salvelinus alpinus]|uniref:leucine rich adaptor protein 1-like n=1 Tax=Salvelinus alpinus TaxID=8036 RepID=UPI0039FBAA74